MEENMDLVCLMCSLLQPRIYCLEVERMEEKLMAHNLVGQEEHMLQPSRKCPWKCKALQDDKHRTPSPKGTAERLWCHMMPAWPVKGFINEKGNWLSNVGENLLERR